jgi:ATP-dependent helicase/nuclease subunit A
VNSIDMLNHTEHTLLRASDPKASAFVSANAGSGKTFVLVKRILRLLLEGVDPSRILALTYTTAAAANMSIRVFRELSDWVSMSDEELILKIAQIDNSTVTLDRIKLARQLFARTLETPGGLKIQTIHAFCEMILHSFPFEANVPANFEILDDNKQSSLMKLVRNQLMGNISADGSDEFSASLIELINLLGEYEFDSMVTTTIKQTQDIRKIIKDRVSLDKLYEEIKKKLKIQSAATANELWRQIYDDRLNEYESKEIAQILLNSTQNDQKIGLSLLESNKYEFGEDWKALYLSIFFNSSMEPRAERGFITNSIRKDYPKIFERLLNEKQRVSDLFEQIKVVDAYARTRSLLIVTNVFLNLYDSHKTSAGMLDFDDLILCTKELLSQTSALWVLYKLDNGIEHILLDEAQDTSPNQWKILKLLTEEFYSGESNKLGIRTIFAVGDPKQSIYSFQGAEPNAFSINKTFFKSKFQQLSINHERELGLFQDEKLIVSFRSTPEILYAVDRVFSIPENFRGLDQTPEATVHISQRMDDPGLVEIWSPVTTEKTPIEENWDAPLDTTSNRSAVTILARYLADHIKLLVDPNSTERIYEFKGQQRKILPGDILILVRKRSKFFEAIIRLLKDAGLPVAGADRLSLNDHIAVMDLIALGKAIITPEDDLMLASLLKSPLFGFSEDDLMLLAAERTGSLIDALYNDTTREIFKSSKLIFQNFLTASKKDGPFSFYSFVLGVCGGRRSFRSRFGAEADDVIDEFLRLSLEHEQKQAPSLLRFINDLTSSNFTVKRDMDSGRNQIRVMTIHGAKGLEAPIVYMPDTFGNSVDKQKLDPIFNLSSDPNEFIPIWSPSQATDSNLIAKLREEAFMKEAEEHRRLLYVAMTRARDRLYVCGYHNRKNRPKDCWYSIIHDALSDEMVEVLDGSVPISAKRLQLKPFPETRPIVETDNLNEKIDIPQWLTTFPPWENEAPGTLNPSEALEFRASSLKRTETELSMDARRRGILIHKLLEYLPEIADERRFSTALDYLKVEAADLGEREHFDIIDNAVKTLNLLDISAFFSKDSRSEVDIIGELRREGKPTRQVKGTIDRIAVTEDTVFIGDFKTTASPPSSVEDVPDQTIAQLAVYGALVSDIFPDKKIRCFVVYTAGPEVVELPFEVLKIALSHIE